MIAGAALAFVLFLAIAWWLRFLDERARGPRVPFRFAERPPAELDNTQVTRAERAAKKARNQ